jgi:hypothetical protein
MNPVFGPLQVMMPLAMVAVGCGGEPAEAPSTRRLAAAAPTAASVVAEDQPIAPAEYLRLHNLAASAPTTDPRGWTDALAALAVSGDGYTLERLRALDRASLTAEQVTTLDATIAALQTRLAADAGPPSAAEIEVRLERAAWADLHCDRCEHTLVPWATSSIADLADDPGVRSALERLRDGDEPSVGHEAKTQWGSLSDRVRRYARDILAGQGGQAAKQTP